MKKGDAKRDTVPCVRYRITSKTKIIWKLICAWTKLQSSRRQSIAFICEVMYKSFGDGDLIANAVASNNEKVLTIMREFTSDVCVVEFDSNADNIPSLIDLIFYKDTDALLYEWLNKQTSILNSLSFAIYSFIRMYGMKDVVSVIVEFMLKDRSFFDAFDLLPTASTNNNAGSTGTDTNGKLDIDAVL